MNKSDETELLESVLCSMNLQEISKLCEFKKNLPLEVNEYLQEVRDCTRYVFITCGERDLKIAQKLFNHLYNLVSGIKKGRFTNFSFDKETCELQYSYTEKRQTITRKEVSGICRLAKYSMQLDNLEEYFK